MAAAVVDADSTYSGAPPDTQIKVGARSRSAGKFAARDCRSQAESFVQKGELGLLQGSGTSAEFLWALMLNGTG